MAPPLRAVFAVGDFAMKVIDWIWPRKPKADPEPTRVGLPYRDVKIQNDASHVPDAHKVKPETARPPPLPDSGRLRK